MPHDAEPDPDLDPTASDGAWRRLPDGAARRDLHGLSVLRLHGSPRQMGYQHGALLHDEIRRGPLPYYRSYVNRLLSHSPLGPAGPPLGRLIERGVGGRVIKALPPFAREAIEGLAQGADLPLQPLLEGCAMPDTLVWIFARLMRLGRAGPAVTHRVALGLGCTSAIAWDDATTDGKLLHARNFDYHGVSCWPDTAAVIFHQPDEGLRYVSVTAAGVLMGGVTAMNEAGLTLTVHQHMFTDRAALGGTPIGVVGDMVMRQARSLSEARAILRAHRPIGCWTYLIADGARREVLCHEENPERQASLQVERNRQTFGYANIYLDPELGASERDLYGAYWRANMARHARSNALLARATDGSAPPLTPDGMAAILADEGDSACRIHNALAMLMTVGSVVFCPERGVVWVATGGAPTSQNRFEPFDLATMDHAPDVAPLDGGVPKDAQAARAFRSYRDAYLAYFDGEDVGQARRLMDSARELAPDQPLYQALAGFLALRAGAPAAAFSAFSAALELGHPDTERLTALHLWRGRAADLLGRRRDAKRDYRAALACRSDPPVAQAARRNLVLPYRARLARRMVVDFTYADVASP
jgi:tetratricopeptide (TPR) repeat protein